MNPISKKIGGVFIPVRNVENARDWYCDLLGLPTNGDIFFDHIYVLPLEGPNIVLDSKLYSPENIFQVPAFQLNTNDIKQAYQYMIEKNVELITGIEHGHWFNFKDPDGNILMICQ
ncbi:VOC family protein [Metabacillus malikii]|uniref:Catechol 2,3-dioxygenase-like lactoylglutathione lyase family enzyme n=1 Tax=Metabacillus malikii TaxID=1504265 RepID=A0ABT9ZCS1_9BACI|nr:VOC family protein [Metabacillus malikii]MDQ0230064.1 catechol 2,3-dioxygenase-like lactoylglutathione lyase family enzyme [Metabacillus malikii]